MPKKLITAMERPLGKTSEKQWRETQDMLRAFFQECLKIAKHNLEE
jgi:hypothetical protein